METLFILLPLELKVKLFESYLTDRLNLLRCVCLDWKEIIDNNVRQWLKRKTNDLVYFETTSLEDYGKDVVRLIQTSELKAKALQNGVPLKLSQLYPITIDIVIQLAKKGDIDSLNELSKSWPFVKSKFFAISSNLSKLAKSLLFECKSTQVCDWFLKNLKLFVKTGKKLIIFEKIQKCLSHFSIYDSMIEYDAKLIDSRLRIIDAKSKPILKNCVFDLSKGFAYKDMVDYGFERCLLVNYHSKCCTFPNDYLLLAIIKSRNFETLFQYYAQIKTLSYFNDVSYLFFATFSNYLLDEEWVDPFNAFPELYMDASKFNSIFDKMVKFLPHLLKPCDLHDHFLQTDDFKSMAFLLEKYQHQLNHKRVPFCSLQMFRAVFHIDKSESDYSVCQLQHLMMLNAKNTTEPYDKATEITKGRNLQQLFNKNQLHATITFADFIRYLIERVANFDSQDQCENYNPYQKETDKCIRFKLSTPDTLSTLSTLDIEILGSLVKYFKTVGCGVLESFLNNLMKAKNTEIVSLIFDCFISKGVSHYPRSLVLNHFYQDLVDSVLSIFKQCDRFLIDYVKKSELKPQKSRFHLIDNCENLSTLIYLLESDVLSNLEFHEIMNVLNQLMKADRLDIFTDYLNKKPHLLETIKNEYQRIELFLHYPSNQYKHLIHNYFKTYEIFVTDRHIKE